MLWFHQRFTNVVEWERVEWKKKISTSDRHEIGIYHNCIQKWDIESLFLKTSLWQTTMWLNDFLTHQYCCQTVFPFLYLISLSCNWLFVCIWLSDSIRSFFVIFSTLELILCYFKFHHIWTVVNIRQLNSDSSVLVLI